MSSIIGLQNIYDSTENTRAVSQVASQPRSGALHCTRAAAQRRLGPCDDRCCPQDGWAAPMTRHNPLTAKSPRRSDASAASAVSQESATPVRTIDHVVLPAATLVSSTRGPASRVPVHAATSAATTPLARAQSFIAVKFARPTFYRVEHGRLTGAHAKFHWPQFLTQLVLQSIPPLMFIVAAWAHGVAGLRYACNMRPSPHALRC